MDCTRPEQKISVIEETEVLVVGAGPAGIGAAVAAARAGAKVVLIDSTGAPGGISTVGLMSHWTGTVDNALYREILERSARKNDFSNEVTTVIDPEKLKILYIEMLAESNVKLMLYTFASGVIMDGNEVKGVIIENKSGTSVIKSQIVIDASGDGDIAAKAGRNISGTHMAHSNFRAMPICLAIGNASGTAAAIVIRKKCRPRDVSASDIQSELE